MQEKDADSHEVNPTCYHWMRQNGKTNPGTFSPFLRLANSSNTGNTPAVTATATTPTKLSNWENDSSLFTNSHSTRRKMRSSGLSANQERACSPCTNSFMRESRIPFFMLLAA